MFQMKWYQAEECQKLAILGYNIQIPWLISKFYKKNDPSFLKYTLKC